MAGTGAAALVLSPVPPMGASCQQPVSKRMILAGKQAFIAGRANLSDLYDYYDCDLETMLRDIYRAMAGAAA